MFPGPGNPGRGKKGGINYETAFERNGHMHALRETSDSNSTGGNHIHGQKDSDHGGIVQGVQ